MKSLIVNADDFGFTSDVNAGIIHAHREGILTSTTLMANGDAFDDAVALARKTPALGVGVHLVLIQGRSIATGLPLPLTARDLLVALTRKQVNVYLELRAQVRKILAAGIRPTHFDSHKHTHVLPSIFRIVARLAEEFGIPFVRVPVNDPLRRYYLRVLKRHGIRTTDHFIGFGLTGSLNETSLAAGLGGLREGTTEFMCHPGYLGPELRGAATRLKESRVRELEALTSPRIRTLLNEAGVRLHPYCAEDFPQSTGRPSR